METAVWVVIKDGDSCMGRHTGLRQLYGSSQRMETAVWVVKMTATAVWIVIKDKGSRDSLLIRTPDSWSKGCEFESRQERQDQSQLCVLTLILCPLHPRVSQWHVKDPGHSVKSAGGRLHLNTHTFLTHQVGVGWLCRCPGIVWESIRKRAHTQLVRERSVTVVSIRRATVDWSWP